MSGYRIEIRSKDRTLAQQVAKRAAAVARQTAPKRTGTLRRSIGVEPTAQGYAVVARAAHAAYVELGTVTMKAKPYLGPAVRQAQREAGARVWSRGSFIEDDA